MGKFKFVLITLFFNSIIYANTSNLIENDAKITKDNIQNVQKVVEKKEIDFNKKSSDVIKKLLKTRKKPSLFLSKKLARKYYRNFNYGFIWVDERGIKDIALNLIENIKNDPVLKPHAKKAFKLKNIINALNTLDKSPDKYLESMARIDFMLTGIYNKYMNYLSKGFINWRSFKKQLRKLEKDEILADWEKHNVKRNLSKLLLDAINQNDLQVAFKEVNYTFPKAKELTKEISKFEKISLNGGYTKIPHTETLRKGDESPIVNILRKRLLESNDLLANDCNIEINAEKIVTNNISSLENNEPTRLVTEEVSVFTKTNKKTNVKEEIKKEEKAFKAIETDCYNRYDDTVVNAVKSFQKSHGLTADGILGPTTRKYLNIPVEKKIIKMRLNVERMRWLPRSLGEKFLVVNIPEYKLKMYNKGEVKLDMAIVVGERKHPTPVFSHKMSFIVLNPYWRIPPRIAKREIIPKLLKNPAYLNGKGINLHPNWDHNSTKFPLNSIDWNLYDEKRVAKTISYINEYDEYVEEVVQPERGPTLRFIQVPSNKNPLGRMKFMFPNKYSVYLHDTPTKRHFAYTKRAYSHGCIRLSKPKALLEAIAKEDSRLDYSKATEILKDIDKTQIGLENKIPVHMVYLTSWIDENGKLQFRDDVYRYDRMQKKLLYKANQYM